MNDDERRWLEDRFEDLKGGIAGVNKRLDTLNGSVKADHDTVVRHEQSLGLVRWLAAAVVVSLIGLGAELLPKLLALAVK